MPYARAGRARDAAQRLQGLVHAPPSVELTLVQIRLAPGARHPQDWQRADRIQAGHDEGSLEGFRGIVHLMCDGGGYSGGTLERPALQRLIQDIEAGRVDTVVCYKIDRLSRSLTDFAKLVDVFERNSVTFVSVTQSFCTTTSMGRLTLNILLWFAQFERELAGERIRDQFAASRRKGIFMGGHPPLGYDVRDRKLVVNPAAANLVRLIFRRFLDLGSALMLIRDLNAEGYRTKSWTTQAGTFREGRLFDKGTLYKILRNRTYPARPCTRAGATRASTSRSWTAGHGTGFTTFWPRTRSAGATRRAPGRRRCFGV
jgi:DNA invertase Pin-like site-specific DNA recombinase